MNGRRPYAACVGHPSRLSVLTRILYNSSCSFRSVNRSPAIAIDKHAFLVFISWVLLVNDDT